MNKEQIKILKEEKEKAMNGNKIVRKNGKIRNTGIRRKKGSI